MLCFVSENKHPESAAETSADYGDSKKGCLRDAKIVLYGPSLVITH